MKILKIPEAATLTDEEEDDDEEEEDEEEEESEATLINQEDDDEEEEGPESGPSNLCERRTEPTIADAEETLEPADNHSTPTQQPPRPEVEEYDHRENQLWEYPMEAELLPELPQVANLDIEEYGHREDELLEDPRDIEVPPEQPILIQSERQQQLDEVGLPQRRIADAWFDHLMTDESGKYILR